MSQPSWRWIFPPKAKLAQCRYVDDEVDICQSNAICRYIGRRYGLYGSNRSEAAQIDQIMDGVEDLRIKYVHLIYKDQLVSTN